MDGGRLTVGEAGSDVGVFGGSVTFPSDLDLGGGGNGLLRVLGFRSTVSMCSLVALAPRS